MNEITSTALVYFFIDLTAQLRVILDIHSVAYDVVRASRNVKFSRAKLCRICMKPALNFSLFWLLRTQFKVLDKIKHLFGQFQTVYRNMAGLQNIWKARLRLAFHRLYKPAIFL